MTASYVTAADVNHDGAADLAVAGSNGLAVLRGLGTGAFTAPVALPTTIGQYWVGAADFNNDGNIDLVGDGSPTLFFAGRGDGSFAPGVTTATVPVRGVTGDFNGDGKMDIAYMVSGFSQERLASQTISVLIGTGTGQFLNALSAVFSGSATGSVAAGDFDGDGLDDVAIWLTLPSRLYFLQYTGARLVLIPGDVSAIANADAQAADVDGNGSKDLLLTSASSVTVFRDTHGDPPLPALASVGPASVVGGATAQGTVTLGGPAPAGGAVVTLGSDNAAAFPLATTVTIPAGASSATFSIATRAVAAATAAGITASWNSVTQAATLTVVAPYSLTGLTIAPASQYGGSIAQGTLTLSGPADSAATALLSSSNPAAATAPASVTIPAGATSASFPVALQPVAANTPATISASLGGTSQTAGVTSLAPLDDVKITRAEDVVKSFQLRVEATSTNATSTLTVWNAATGSLIGTLSPGGGGKYTGSFTVSPAVLSITVRSSLGGLATGAVTQK